MNWRSSKIIRVAIASVVVVSAFGCAWLQPSAVTTSQTQEATRTFGPAKPFVTLDSKEISESSGIAASYLTPGDYFTHNDSGDTARFFKFDPSGKVVATYSLAGVEATDWEDIASAKVGEQPYLYIADIGDNQSKRERVEVYRLKEPTGGSRDPSDFDTYEITYPDGPHNAETLMVRPGSGDIYIVTKTDKGPSEVFKLAKPTKSGKYTPVKIGELSFGSAVPGSKLITAGDISPDSKHIVIRTYWAGYEFEAPTKFDDWVNQKPIQFSTPSEMQGEAICYSLDGRQLLTSSEGTPCKISVIPIH